MFDFLLDPKVMTFVCFGWWVLSMAIYVFMLLLNPVHVTEKINLRLPRDIILLSGALAWITMWCFRTMY